MFVNAESSHHGARVARQPINHPSATMHDTKLDPDER
jgi:hypothetical protein